MYCTTVPQAQHSTAQSQPAQSRKASTSRSECDNASKQTGLARVSTCRRSYVQHGEFSKRTKTSKSARPTKIHHYPNSDGGVMREGLAFSVDLSKISRYAQHCSFSPPFFYVRIYARVHACGVRVAILEHGALDTCKSSVCTQNRGPLCPLHSHFPFYSSL